MPAPLLPILLAGLRALTARAAVGAVTRGLAAEGVESAVGKKLVSGFIEKKVAQSSVNVFRGVSAEAIKSEFTAPAAGKEAAKVIYESSRAAAQKAAGEGGRVLEMRLPRTNLAAYSPLPIQGGGTSFQVPFAEHFQAAKRAATVNSAMQTPLGRVVTSLLDFPSAPRQQAANSLTRDYAGPVSSAPAPASASPAQGSLPRQWPDAMRQAGSRAVQSARNWLAGSSGSNAGYNDRKWSPAAGVRNLFSSAGGSSWQPSSTPSGPAQVQPFQGGGPSFPHISPSNLVGMMGQPQHQIAQQNANNGAQQASQQQQAQQQLAATTQKLSGAFKNLLASTGKTAIWGAGATLSGAATYTGAMGAAIEGKLDRGQYHSGFAGMAAQRRIQDIQLTRNTAQATAPSAKYLNAAQMEGREQLSSMWRKAEPLLNHLLGAGQRVANVVLKIADKVLLLDYLESVDKALQQLLGIEEDKKMEKDLNTPHDILNEARLQAMRGRKAKAPIQGIK